MIIGLIEPKDISLTIPMAEKYWHRVSFMKVLTQYFALYTMGLATPVLGYQFWTQWPQQYFLLHGIRTYISCMLWVWYLTPHTINLILIFHQMCYYLQLRFDFVNDLLKKFSTLKSRKSVCKLNQILKEHDQICDTLYQYNKFWCITLLLDAFLYTSMVLLISYLSLFSGLIMFLRLFFGSFTLTFVLCLCFIFTSAASVSTKVSKIVCKHLHHLFCSLFFD